MKIHLQYAVPEQAYDLFYVYAHYADSRSRANLQCAYCDAHTEVIDLDIPSESTFYDERDPEIDMLVPGSRVTWNNGTKTFSLNRVYHESTKFRGRLSVSYDSAIAATFDCIETFSESYSRTPEYGREHWLRETDHRVFVTTGPTCSPDSYLIDRYTKKTYTDLTSRLICEVDTTNVIDTTRSSVQGDYYVEANGAFRVECVVFSVSHPDVFTTVGVSLPSSGVNAVKNAAMAFNRGQITDVKSVAAQAQSDAIRDIKTQLGTLSIRKTGKAFHHRALSGVPSEASIIAYILRGVGSSTGLSQYLSKGRNANFLAWDAYQDIGFVDNNGLSFLKEATEMRGMFQSCAKSLTGLLRSNRQRCKSVAQLYLGQHYGMKLTVNDTRDYIRGLQKGFKRIPLVHRVSAVHVNHLDNNVKVTSRYQCFYRDRAPKGKIPDAVNDFLHKTDTVPTPENLWDMVKLSFVVDWFVDVSSSLTAIGNMNQLTSYYEVVGACFSTTVEQDINLLNDPDANMHLDGNLTHKLFVRQPLKNAIVPIRAQDSIKPASPLRHGIEAGALVVTSFLK